MFLREKRTLGFLSVLWLLLMALGCAAPAYRTHPEFETRSKDIKTVGLIPPDIKIYEVTAGGVRELRDDQSTKVKEDITKAIIENFKEKPIELKVLTVNKETEEEIEEILASYEAVSMSIRQMYGPFLQSRKKENLDYSIGSVEGLLQKYKIDALIFVYGSDEIFTGGRKALTGMKILIAGALTGGSGASTVPWEGRTDLSVALVDKSGSILWYSVKSDSGMGAYNLSNPKSVEKLVKSILSDFSKAVK